ncbi:SpaA isopeptide-forming pilin-related protein [Pseudactinotalea sp. HY158]|uniref:SpaA isopeptide-forming pilin-related protein n=1 Tax=Pseudactinotalea sp. HY158 TaxID=2654547 RepID=UPI00129C207D|nr:SpaA isopeptide-forming pilin-related protein [Pseudactinotalea sp. HY158]QGH70770.1 hypothetical protein GCE65_15655 [Pseudactinotalea sp. HY158]
MTRRSRAALGGLAAAVLTLGLAGAAVPALAGDADEEPLDQLVTDAPTEGATVDNADATGDATTNSPVTDGTESADNDDPEDPAQGSSVGQVGGGASTPGEVGAGESPTATGDHDSRRPDRLGAGVAPVIPAAPAGAEPSAQAVTAAPASSSALPSRLAPVPFGNVTTGTIDAQVSSLTNGVSNRLYANYNGSNYSYSSSGPSGWVDQNGEAFGGHGASSGYHSGNYITSKMSAIGVTPSTGGTVASGSPFLLASTTHYNHVIYPQWYDSEYLNGELQLRLNGFGGQVLKFPWRLWETTNDGTSTGGSATCADGNPRYGTDSGLNDRGCADLITFTSQISNTVLTKDGVDYRLVIDGFYPAAGDVCPAEMPSTTQNSFWTREDDETTACIYGSLTQVRSLTVVKQVVDAAGVNIPNFPFSTASDLDGSAWEDDGTPLTFGLKPPSATESASRTGEILQGEAVTITENPPTGWVIDDIQCSGAGVTSDDYTVSNGTVTITAPFADGDSTDITCTYTNKPLKGTVTWSKTDAATDVLLGGSTWTLELPDSTTRTITDCVGGTCGTALYTDQDAAVGKFKLTGLPLGTYSLTEQAAPNGYVADTQTRTFTIGAGDLDEAFGEIKNIAKASLVVQKEWVINGGAPVPNGEQPAGLSAALQLAGADHNWDTALAGLQGDVITLAETTTIATNDPTVTGCTVDSQAITEINGAAATGDLSGGGTVDVTLTEIENTATVTNTVSCQTLTIIKSVDAGDFGTDVAAGSAWDGYLFAERDGSMLTFDSGDTKHVVSGTYVVSEDVTAVPGYEFESLACTAGGDPVASDYGNVQVASGEDVTCVLTNRALPGSVSWSKVNRNDDLLAGSVWTLTGPGLASGVSVTDCTKALCSTDPFTDQNPDAGEFLIEGLKWGDYTLVETTAPPGYQLDETERTFTITAANLDYGFAEAFVNDQQGGPALPLTGGFGRDHVYIAGAATLLLSLMAYGATKVQRRRSRRSA